MVKDFKYLNTPDLLGIYKPHEGAHRESMADMISAEIEFYKRNKLLRDDAQALKVKFTDAQIMFFDFTDLGQDFLMSQQVEKWREAYSRRKTKNPTAVADSRDLDRRFAKFLKQRRAASH